MKRIFINEDNLNKEDIEDVVIRVKGLIINSKNELLLAHNNGTYQFPGGHMEDGEGMEETLIREISEETGIDILLENGPFMQIVTYDSNYFDTGKRVENKIYYYAIHTDEMPNYQKTHYDELECQTDFDLFYIALDELNNFFENAMNEGSLDRKIGREMLFVIDEYNRIYNEK